MAGSIEASKKRARRGALAFRWLLSALVVLSVLGGTAVLLMARQLGPMFDDMLSDAEDMPALTKMVVHGWMLLLVFFWLLAAASIFWIFHLRRAHHALVLAFGAAVVVGGAGCFTAMFLLTPLVEVIQNNRGR